MIELLELMISKIKQHGLSKASIQSILSEVETEVLDDGEASLKYMALSKLLEDMGKQLQSSSLIKSKAVEEVERHGLEGGSCYGISFSKKNSTTYTYKVPFLDELAGQKAEIKKVEDKVKQLAKIGEQKSSEQVFVDEETGEEFKIPPALSFTTETVSRSYQRNK